MEIAKEENCSVDLLIIFRKWPSSPLGSVTTYKGLNGLNDLMKLCSEHQNNSFMENMSYCSGDLES